MIKFEDLMIYLDIQLKNVPIKTTKIQKIENCPYGIFYPKIHTKNEYNYHPECFRKIFKCTRPKIKIGKKEKCKFYKTCYGWHEKEEEETESEEEEEFNIEESEIDENEEIKELKKEINKILKICKVLICRNCMQFSNNNVICYFSGCKHYLCYTCFIEINKNTKKKQKEENIEIKCPFCQKKIEKSSVIKLDFNKVKD